MGVERLFKSFLAPNPKAFGEQLSRASAAMGASTLMACDFCGLVLTTQV
jgi:hypothetical protein